MSSEDPIYLSVVVASRNDDHGGNLLYRMQLFVSTLLEQIDRRRLRCEIVLVEWNPPNDRPSLSEVLSGPAQSPYCDVRIITVPNQVHRQFEHSDVLDLYQFIAKNVGIRRARGCYVLATNIDILFSEELMDYLGAKRLRDYKMVRVDRYDVPPEIGEAWDTHRRLKYCRDNAIRVYKSNGTYEIGSRGLYQGFRRLLSVTLLKSTVKRLLRPSFKPRVHTNACGDFTLMAREHWHRLRGYPDFPWHGYNLDGLLCYAAVSAGIRQRVLKSSQCVYHIDHLLSWTPAQSNDLRTHLRRKTVPVMSDAQYNELVEQMQRTKKPILFNGNEWGLASEAFPEHMIAGT